MFLTPHPHASPISPLSLGLSLGLSLTPHQAPHLSSFLASWATTPLLFLQGASLVPVA